MQILAVKVKVLLKVCWAYVPMYCIFINYHIADYLGSWHCLIWFIVHSCFRVGWCIYSWGHLPVMPGPVRPRRNPASDCVVINTCSLPTSCKNSRISTPTFISHLGRCYAVKWSQRLQHANAMRLESQVMYDTYKPSFIIQTRIVWARVQRVIEILELGCSWVATS